MDQKTNPQQRHCQNLTPRDFRIIWGPTTSILRIKGVQTSNTAKPLAGSLAHSTNNIRNIKLP
jgi:hypothetical protein